MAHVEKTKCGIEPDFTEIPYRISTKDAEEYLQRGVNCLVNDIRKKLKDSGKDSSHIRDVRFTLMTNDISKKFRPFIIAIPIDEAIKGRKGQSDNLSIYDNEENENNVQMHDWLFKFLSTFSFNKSDRQAFDSIMFRKEFGITPAVANELKRLSTPRTYSTRSKGDKPTHIVLYIDPIRVFKNMLRSSEHEKFKVVIKREKMKELHSGDWSYMVIKEPEARTSKIDERQQLEKLLNKNITNRK